MRGDFSGGWFEFAVHSPSRAGLQEGHSYTVKPVWTGAGYEVDQYQWKGPPRILPTVNGELDDKALWYARIIGRVLDREEALTDPWLKDAFHITDHIVVDDQPVKEYLDGQGA